MQDAALAAVRPRRAEFDDPADVVAVAKLYRHYKSWGEQSGYKNLLTKQKFGREVPKVFPALGKSTPRGARVWLGLRQRHPEQAAA